MNRNIFKFTLNWSSISESENENIKMSIFDQLLLRNVFF